MKKEHLANALIIGGCVLALVWSIGFVDRMMISKLKNQELNKQA